MSTPYVSLQELIIRALFNLCEKEPETLRALAKKIRRLNPPSLYTEDRRLLERAGFFKFPEEPWALNPTTVLEQIDDSGEEIRIRNLLGMKLHGYGTVLDAKAYAKVKGLGDNFLRTDSLAQPSALKIGDVLASGCRVLSEPREGGNGAVLVHLSGGLRGHWIEVPSRIPIALLTPEDNVPEGYVDQDG